jgi:hypothetical protein
VQIGTPHRCVESYFRVPAYGPALHESDPHMSQLDPPPLPHVPHPVKLSVIDAESQASLKVHV